MIIYLHGFRSGPASSKIQELAGHMEDRGLADQLWCEQLSPVPFEAVAQAEAAIAACTNPPTLVGSSLGGFYATHLAEKHELRAVLVNPAVFRDGYDPSPFVGEHEHLYTGERFSFTWEHVAQAEALRVERISHPQNFWLMVEEGDEVLDARLAIAHFAGARQTVLPGGDHGFSRWPEYLDEVLRFAGLVR